MTTDGSSFLLATLCVCVMANYTFAQSTGGPNQECEANTPSYQYYYFGDCVVSNFSAHLPVTTGKVSVTFGNVRIVDMDGCVRWLTNISQLSQLKFGGNDPSFLDCLTNFNRSLPLTYGALLSIRYTSLPLDDWIAATFKILFGKTTHWENIQISYSQLVTRVPKAFGDQGVVNVYFLEILNTGVSAIEEHDFDGYKFYPIDDYSGLLQLIGNKICYVELAAFRNAPNIYMYGNPVDKNGVDIDWKQLANRYPNATALATDPVCADALNTADYQVIDTFYSGITIIQRSYRNPAATTVPPFTERTSTIPPSTDRTSTKSPSTENTSDLPSPTTTGKASASTGGSVKSFVYEAVKFVKSVKVKILGGTEAEMLSQSKNLFASASASASDSDSDSDSDSYE